MSKMTTRLSDSQLADIAKQKYETHQINRVPGVVVDLPSRGLVYPKTSVLRSGTVEMRYMTAYDEDILTNKNYIQRGIIFDKLLQSVITTPGFDVTELIDADKSWLILMVRITSYESEYPVTVTAPNNQSISTTVNLSKLKFKSFQLTPDDNGEFEYKTLSGDSLKFKYLSSTEINNLPEDHAVSYLLHTSIKQVNSTRDANEIKEWIQYKFLRKDAAEFRKYMQINSPDVNMDYEFEYINEEGAMEAFHSRFPIGSDFFWL
jgi:hypothetical protein